jgi:hypothetical protein
MGFSGLLHSVCIPSSKIRHGSGVGNTTLHYVAVFNKLNRVTKATYKLPDRPNNENDNYMSDPRLREIG